MVPMRPVESRPSAMENSPQAVKDASRLYCTREVGVEHDVVNPNPHEFV